MFISISSLVAQQIFLMYVKKERSILQLGRRYWTACLSVRTGPGSAAVTEWCAAAEWHAGKAAGWPTPDSCGKEDEERVKREEDYRWRAGRVKAHHWDNKSKCLLLCLVTLRHTANTCKQQVEKTSSSVCQHICSILKNNTLQIRQQRRFTGDDWRQDE